VTGSLAILCRIPAAPDSDAYERVGTPATGPATRRGASSASGGASFRATSFESVIEALLYMSCAWALTVSSLSGDAS
jgi:hypothetical protein